MKVRSGVITPEYGNTVTRLVTTIDQSTDNERNQDKIDLLN